MDDYKYTKPKRPVGAMNRGPGPRYSLPNMVGHESHDPRSTYPRQPAFSFGVRHSDVFKVFSPGPAALTEKVYRDGNDSSRHYSLVSRPRGLRPSGTPSPSAYSVDKAGPLTHAHYPAYSFGCRRPHVKTDQTPAANVYTIPAPSVESGKKRAPAFSLRGISRTGPGSFAADFAKTPGPCQYDKIATDMYKTQAPAFSIDRQGHQFHINSTNGWFPYGPVMLPEQHQRCLEESTRKKADGPMYSFGIRHSQFEAPLIVDAIE